MVPGMVVRVTVSVVFAVGLIVLVVIGDQVVEIEAVVGGDKIDARPRFATTFIEEVAGPRDSRGKVGKDAIVALPEASHGIAKFVIPLRPTGWELTYLVTAGTNVP